MRRSLTSTALALGLLLGLAGGAFAGQPVKTTIWLDGEMVRTILPPATSPKEGTDPFYMVPGTGGVAPSDRATPGITVGSGRSSWSRGTSRCTP